MNRVSVLVVDDASFIRDLVKKGLRDQFPGIQIEEAANGRKAQVRLERGAVDLILCDWEMPEMSGLDLLNWCRAQQEHQATPFIMVTSRGDKTNVVEAIQAGVSDYMGKPFSNDQLVTKVRKALHKAGKLSALERGAPARINAGSLGNESLAALTGGRASSQPATGSRETSPPPAAAGNAGPPPTAGRGQGQLRLAAGAMPCVIKALSLKDAQLVIKRGEMLPQVLETAVLDLEQGEAEATEVARLNGYIHAISAFEPRPDSTWLQLVFRFVDQDAQKLDYLSRLIARGSTQKHYTPGA